jgi:hypothetical protein
VPKARVATAKSDVPVPIWLVPYFSFYNLCIIFLWQKNNL